MSSFHQLPPPATRRPGESLAAPAAAGQGAGIKVGDTVLSGGVELKVRSIYRNVAEVVSFSGAFIGYRAVSNLQQVV